MAKGWHNESRRHALASKGVSTGSRSCAVDKATYYSLSRPKKIDALIKKMNAHCMEGNCITNENRAAKLMDERMSPEQLDDEVFIRITNNKESEKLFQKNKTDPTLPIVFIETDFARKNKGNITTPSRVEELKAVIKKGEQFDDVPIYDLKTKKIEEGNHRVKALLELGYESVPVRLTGGWD